MTIPKWLLPVLSVVAALAVGIGAALIGTRFASADVQSSPAKTVTAPVYGPLADGQKLSTSQGTAAGSAPSTDGSPISGDQRALIHDVINSPDPAATIRDETIGTPSGSGSGSSGSPAPTTPVGDACSPSSGEPPAGCPDGIHGAVFASHMLPPLWMNALAFPAVTASAPSTPRCPAATGAGHVTIGVASDLPADYSVTYWPTGDTADREVARFSTDATQVAAFNAYYSGTGTGPSPVEHSCTVLTVEPGTGYTAQVGAIDSVGRAADPVTILFNGSGAPLHPELELNTVGGNLLFASALHAPDEVVQIHMVPRSATYADCNSTNVYRADSEVGSSRVTTDYLNDHQVLPADTQRTSDVFFVPEGSDFLVCARWYPAGHVPSWRTSTPLYESQQAISSPDRLLPTVTLTDLSPNPDDQTVRVQFSSAGGVVCGPQITWRHSAGRTGGVSTPTTVCSMNGFGGARGDGSRYWDLGANDLLYFHSSVEGNITSFDNPDGYLHLTTTCAGECRVPADQHFAFSLFDGGATDGSFAVTVHYDQGSHNGAADWVMGSVQGRAPSYVPPAAPSFDTDVVATAGPISYGTISSSAIVHIDSDRAVNYTVTARGAGTATTCLRSGDGTANGHLDAPADVSVTGLCLGASYDLEVRLTDAAGHSSIWGSRGADPDHTWTGNVVATPTIAGTIRFDFRPYGSGQSEIGDVTMSLGTATLIDGRSPLEQACRPDGLFNLQASVPNVRLGQELTLRLGYDTQSSDSGNPGCHPQSGAPLHAAMAEIPVQLTQLYGTADGLLITQPGGATGYWTLHMWFDAAPHS